MFTKLDKNGAPLVTGADTFEAECEAARAITDRLGDTATYLSSCFYFVHNGRTFRVNVDLYDKDDSE